MLSNECVLYKKDNSSCLESWSDLTLSNCMPGAIFKLGFCGSFLLFMFHVCHAFLSVHCSLMVTCWEKAYLFALLCMMFYCVFVTFPCRVWGQVWNLIVSISDLCLFTYFAISMT